MDDPYVLRLDDPEATLERVGGKGASLARLAAAGLPVPPGFHVTTSAYRRFVNDNNLADSILSAVALANSDEPASLDQASAQIHSLFLQSVIPGAIAEVVRRSYGELGSENEAVAVRSSATAEDLPGMSFAGQQETYLNVRGGDSVLEAVRKCWASLWTARAIGYRARQGIRPEDVSIAVVVQELVPADVAGILFTANPVTGARAEVVINAAWGLGEAIVAGRVRPDTLVVNKQTGAVASAEIADKKVMTALLPEGIEESPVAPDKQKRAALENERAIELSRLGTQIEELYGQPMDIEWALRDGRFAILQARPITALPEPPTTLDWSLPRPGRQYARSSVIELLPDPLSPLFATLALPLWNEAMTGMAEKMGFWRLMEDMSLVTINDYAYYDFEFGVSRVIPLLISLPVLTPKIVRLLRSARTRWEEEARPRYAAVVASLGARDLAATTAGEILRGVRQIVREAAEHYVTIQAGILPVAYMSEALFTKVYDRLVKREGDPPALTFMLGFDSTPILAEKSLYDLAIWGRTQPELASYMAREDSRNIAAACGSFPGPISDAGIWEEFVSRFSAHLNRFGHAVYDLDFAKSVPADAPAPILETLKFFVEQPARSPHERQGAAALAREQATEALLLRLKGLRLRLVRPLLQTAQRYAPLRENALADVGLGWPLLRRMSLEIGRRMVEAGVVASRDDVFWLTSDELEAAASALDARVAAGDYTAAVSERRAVRARERSLTPPVALPIKGGSRFLGMDFSKWMPARTDQAEGSVIRGIAASPGRVSGAARVILGPDAFSQMRPGDILVAKITTPAWTPLFALASGIVTDVGGPLSHSSIVAREYGIPAVLGTGVATERIHSLQQITVDGDRGTVGVGRPEAA